MHFAHTERALGRCRFAVLALLCKAAINGAPGRARTYNILFLRQARLPIAPLGLYWCALSDANRHKPSLKLGASSGWAKRALREQAEPQEFSVHHCLVPSFACKLRCSLAAPDGIEPHPLRSQHGVQTITPKPVGWSAWQDLNLRSLHSK